MWCSSLQVPLLELLEAIRYTVSISHARAKVIAGHSLAVVSGEIQVHSFSESFLAKQSLVHPNDLRSFLIDRLHIPTGIVTAATHNTQATQVQSNDDAWPSDSHRGVKVIHRYVRLGAYGMRSWALQCSGQIAVGTVRRSAVTGA